MLGIKDPAYAAFVLHEGWELEEIEPSTINTPQIYLFPEESKSAGLGDKFYGVTVDAATISWPGFAGALSRLYRLEDTLLRNRSNRPARSEIEFIGEDKTFTTTVQPVAAYLFKHGCKIHSVDRLGVNFGHIWRFKNARETQSLFVKFNNNGKPEKWFVIKMWMKYATSIRNELFRKVTT